MRIHQANRRLWTGLLYVCAMLALAASGLNVSAQSEADRYLNDVKALTQPSMEGRGDGTRGLTRAAALIEEQYKRLGLQPAGSHGYMQPFTVITGAEIKGRNRFTVQDKTSRADLKLNQDYVPFSFSTSGSAAGNLVFAGYGAPADEFGYDDYTHLDVKGKIVVLLRYEPSGFSAKAGNTGLTQHSQLVNKAINARNHGAAAIVLVNGKLPQGEEDRLTRFGSVSGPVNSGIVLVQGKNDVAEKWFQAAGKSLKQIQEQINSATQPASFAFPADLKIALDVSIETTRATVNNVLAYLPGQTDEYVILGAHYDHLGRGYFD